VLLNGSFFSCGYYFFEHGFIAIHKLTQESLVYPFINIELNPAYNLLVQLLVLVPQL